MNFWISSIISKMAFQDASVWVVPMSLEAKMLVTQHLFGQSPQIVYKLQHIIYLLK